MTNATLHHHLVSSDVCAHFERGPGGGGGFSGQRARLSEPGRSPRQRGRPVPSAALLPCREDPPWGSGWHLPRRGLFSKERPVSLLIYAGHALSWSSAAWPGRVWTCPPVAGHRPTLSGLGFLPGLLVLTAHSPGGNAGRKQRQSAICVYPGNETRSVGRAASRRHTPGVRASFCQAPALFVPAPGTLHTQQCIGDQAGAVPQATWRLARAVTAN